MIGIIDVGGGTRDIFGSGVLDYCLEHGINFDYHLGISAGSANLASFKARQLRRNYRFYMKYAFREEYMSMKNYMETRNYVDFSYIYEKLSATDGEDPLDYRTMVQSPGKLEVVAYDAKEGLPHYFTEADIKENHYEIFSASCCLPVVCQPVIINDIPYYDGGIIDPIPLGRAFNAGCDKVVVILTRPKDFRREYKADSVQVKILSTIDKKASENLALRYKRYNDALEKAIELEKQGKVLIIAPDTINGMSTLTKDKQLLYLLYRKGYNEAEKINNFIQGRK